MFGRRKRIRSSRRIRERRKQLIIRAAIVGVAVPCFIGAIAYLSRLDSINVTEIAVAGNQTVTDENLQSTIRERLDGTLVFLLPKTNIALVFFKTGTLAEILMDTYPRLREVDVSLSDMHALEVTVVERMPHSLWCGERYGMVQVEDSGSATSTMPVDVDRDACYFLDEDGFIFTQAPTFTGNVYFTYYGPVEGRLVGSQYVSPDLFHQYQLFLEELKGLPVDPFALEYASDTVTLHLKDGGFIRFLPKQPLGAVLESIRTVLSAEVFSDPSTLSRLDYIDLRFGNDVYYKFEE